MALGDRFPRQGLEDLPQGAGTVGTAQDAAQQLLDAWVQYDETQRLECASPQGLAGRVATARAAAGGRRASTATRPPGLPELTDLAEDVGDVPGLGAFARLCECAFAVDASDGEDALVLVLRIDEVVANLKPRERCDSSLVRHKTVKPAWKFPQPASHVGLSLAEEAVGELQRLALGSDATIASIVEALGVHRELILVSFHVEDDLNAVRGESLDPGWCALEHRVERARVGSPQVRTDGIRLRRLGTVGGGGGA